MFPRHFERRIHQRKRLFRAVLALAQAFDHRFIAGIANELEAAETLERDDLSGADILRGQVQRVIAVGNDIATRVPKLEVRAATGAPIGLRVEPAIVRVVVFALAERTHLETLHRGVRPGHTARPQ